MTDQQRQRPCCGDRIRWLGEVWTVNAVLPHPVFGEFYSIDADDGRHDLINAEGADGNYEVIERAIA